MLWSFIHCHSISAPFIHSSFHRSTIQLYGTFDDSTLAQSSHSAGAISFRLQQPEPLPMAAAPPEIARLAYPCQPCTAPETSPRRRGAGHPASGRFRRIPRGLDGSAGSSHTSRQPRPAGRDTGPGPSRSSTPRPAAPVWRGSAGWTARRC